MDLTKLGKQLIVHEGFKKLPYVDTTGNITIGVGHNLSADGLTYAQVMSLLQDDITQVLLWLKIHLPWHAQLDDVRQRALADMAFNLNNKLMGFTNMLAALQKQDWQTAHDELLNSTFAKQTGQRAKDLAQMFLTGQDD